MSNGLLSETQIKYQYQSIPSTIDEEDDQTEENGIGDTDDEALDDTNENNTSITRNLPLWDITCILSLAFSYGCIMTTLFLITLPVECQRIENQHPSIPKSVALGIFVAISGASNLVTPLLGMLSDTYRPPKHFELGQRMPYFVLGSICSTIGLLGQYVESYEKLWVRYGFFYFATMIGLNVSYAMMLALIPDQVCDGWKAWLVLQEEKAQV